MPFQPLALKYRPQKFSDLVGQDTVSKALGNAIELGREPRAIIFTGVRGIGKTTTARLYAKALNCELGPQRDPCNECQSCHAITGGVHEDVIEIDGASNTGVADVRALQDTIEYVPQRSKYKVYIIDEVHMLSQAAFNALLKTLEEPPAHVVFVFATTEMHKVPQTIISRCQTFYLQKFSLQNIRARLADILQQESIDFEEKALTIVAREGHGSMRDALTTLDQAIALGAGSVTMQGLESFVTNLSSLSFMKVLEAALDKDPGLVIELIDQLDRGGVEAQTIASEMAKITRHAFILRDLGGESLDMALLGFDDDEVAKLNEIAEKSQPFDLNRIFRCLMKCIEDCQGSTLDRFILENYLLEWCLDPGLPNIDDLINQAKGQIKSPVSFRDMKNSLREMKQAPSQNKVERRDTDKPAANSAPAPVQQESQLQGVAEGEFPATWRELVDMWKIKKPLQARKLEEVHAVEYNKSTIKLIIDKEAFASKTLLKKDEQQKLSQLFKDLFGFEGALSIQVKGDEGPVQAQEPVLPETILDTKQKEAQVRREKSIETAKNAHFTQEVLEKLGGSIKDIRTKQDGN